MAPFAYPWPMKEARYLQAEAIAAGTYRRYHLLSIVKMRYRGVVAADWTFWWKPATTTYRVDVAEVVFTAKTSAGPQPYVLSMSAPAPHAVYAAHVLQVAMRTFTPLP